MHNLATIHAAHFCSSICIGRSASLALSAPRGKLSNSAPGRAKLTQQLYHNRDFRRVHNQRSVQRFDGRKSFFCSCDADAKLQQAYTKISRSFYEACLPELNVRYGDAVRGFVSSCKEAYVAGASVGSVNLQLQLAPATGVAQLDQAVEKRGGLQKEEVELRTNWIATSFLTFELVGVARAQAPPSRDSALDQPVLRDFVHNVFALAVKGGNPQRVTLEEVMKQGGVDVEAISETESAAMSQGIRIVFTALDLCANDPSPAGMWEPPDSSPTSAPDFSSSAASAPSRGSKFAARKEAEKGSKFAARKQAEAKRRAGDSAADSAAVPPSAPAAASPGVQARSAGPPGGASGGAAEAEVAGSAAEEEGASSPYMLPFSVALRWERAQPMFAGIETDASEYLCIDLACPELRRDGAAAPVLSFVIDSASSVNILTPEKAEELEPLQRTGRSMSGTAGTGPLSTMYEVSLGEVEVGGWLLKGEAFRAAVLGIPTAPSTAGLVGLSFLNAFDAVEFNLHAGVPPSAVLYPRGIGATQGKAWDVMTSGMTTLALERIRDGLFRVQARVGGRRVPALLDTGAAFSIASLALGIPTKQGVAPMYVAGADGNPTAMSISESGVEVELFADVNQSAPSVVLDPVEMLVGDLPAFSLLGVQPGEPAVVLGMDALRTQSKMILATSSAKMAI